MSDIQATVFKYDPSVDASPTYKEYTVPWRDSITVLEVLRYIHEEFEPASFDYSCRGASCGLCAMKINGTPAYACATLVQEGDELTIEPLDRFPVIRDLIVDKSAVRDRMLSTAPQFIRDTPMEDPITMKPEAFLTTAILQQCRECMICQSVCPSIADNGFDNYAGPYIMTMLASRYFDEREGQADVRLKTAVHEGLFNCILCGTCTQVCPKGNTMKLEDYEYSFIDHVKYFTKMREDAQAAGLEPQSETAQRPLPEELFSLELQTEVEVVTDIQKATEDEKE